MTLWRKCASKLNSSRFDDWKWTEGKQSGRRISNEEKLSRKIISNETSSKTVTNAKVISQLLQNVSQLRFLYFSNVHNTAFQHCFLYFWDHQGKVLKNMEFLMAFAFKHRNPPPPLRALISIHFFTPMFFFCN